jgi:magnesium-transporting ATPase (P-type)
MCTGDNIDTAIAISKNAGIVTEQECGNGTFEEGNYSCMTGKQFREIVDGLKTDSNGKESPGNIHKFK